MVHISFNGETLGEFSAEQITGLLEAGTITTDAFYFQEGMAEWRPLAELLAPTEETPAPKPKKGSPLKSQVTFLTRRGVAIPETKERAASLIDSIKQSEKAANEAQKAEEARLRSVVSPKQLAFLDYHGVKYSPTITRQEATDIIKNSDFPGSRWGQTKHLLRPDLYEHEAMTLPDYQRAIEEATAKLKALKADKSSDAEAIEDAQDALTEAKEALVDYKDERAEELNLWVEEMSGDMSHEAELFLEAFKKPTKRQIEQIREYVETRYKFSLNAITIPEFFLLYSKLNPDALKKGKSCKFSANDIIIPTKYSPPEKAASTKSGCFGMILLLSSLGFGAVFAFLFLLL